MRRPPELGSLLLILLSALSATLATLLAALSGLLLLLTRLLLPTALLATPTALLTTLLVGLLTTATLLAALAWSLISHDLFLPLGNSRKGQRSFHRFVPCRKVIEWI